MTDPQCPEGIGDESERFARLLSGQLIGDAASMRDHTSSLRCTEIHFVERNIVH
jgi:hypothetical protein